MSAVAGSNMNICKDNSGGRDYTGKNAKNVNLNKRGCMKLTPTRSNWRRGMIRRWTVASRERDRDASSWYASSMYSRRPERHRLMEPMTLHLPSRSDSDASWVAVSQSRLRCTPLPLLLGPWLLSRVVSCAPGEANCGMYSYDELKDTVTATLVGLAAEMTAVALADSRTERNEDPSTSSGVPNEWFAVICLMSASEELSSGGLVMVCC